MKIYNKVTAQAIADSYGSAFETKRCHLSKGDERYGVVDRRFIRVDGVVLFVTIERFVYKHHTIGFNVQLARAEGYDVHPVDLINLLKTLIPKGWDCALIGDALSQGISITAPLSGAPSDIVVQAVAIISEIAHQYNLQLVDNWDKIKV